MIISEKDNDIQIRTKKWMNTYGWTLYQLTKRSGLPESTVRGMFKEGHDARLSTICVLCNTFGVTLSEFFSDHAIIPRDGSTVRTLIMKWGQLNEEQRDVFMKMLDMFIGSTGAYQKENSEGR